MNISKHNYRNTAFKCHLIDLEDGQLLQQNHFNDCLLYVIQPTTYSPKIALARVYFMRDNNIICQWRGRIVDLSNNDYQSLSADNAEPRQYNLVNVFNSLEASILDGRNAYRELLEFVGPATAKAILLSAHDAAALHAFKPNGHLYKRLVKDSYLNGLIANDEEFYTYISLKLIFEMDAVGSQHLISDIEATFPTLMGGKKAQLTLNFRFSHDASPIALPLNVIIGANGVGKTRALLAIAKSMLERSTKRAFRHSRYSNSVIAFSHEAQRWRSIRKSAFKHVPLGITRPDWGKLPAATQEISLLPDNSFSLSTLNNIIKKIIDTRYLYLKMVGQPPKIYSLDQLAKKPEKCARIDLSAEYKYIDAFGLEHPLSSGQRALICFCFNVVLHCRPRSLLLIDEPENHLHPRFISLLMQTLHSVLLATESVAIVATHSPFIVREVDKMGVLILQANEDNLPLLFRPSLQTLGGDVSLISDFVFEDLNVRKGYQESIDQALLACRDTAARESVLQQFAALGLDAAAYARSLGR